MKQHRKRDLKNIQGRKNRHLKIKLVKELLIIMNDSTD